MLDRETFIKKCECCINYYTGFGDCDIDNCEYCGTDVGCAFRLINDALKLLKPRVLSLDEACDAEVCWLEQKGYDPYTTLDACYWNKKTYNIGWRCWSQKPTDEQRKAVSWNE